MKNKKKTKEKKTSSALAPKPKPYTIQQEQDTVIGKMIFWTFLVGFVVVMIIASVLSNKSLPAVAITCGSWCMIFGIYVLVGLWLKLDHARVAAAEQAKEYKNVLRRAWGKKDNKNCLEAGIIYTSLGLLLVIVGVIAIYIDK